MAEAELAEEVQTLGWYHTIDLGDGVVTEGIFDHRPVVDRYMIPADLSGMRCLDVGTMDGFWAFEMERRGADEVVAADLGSPDELDWPPVWGKDVDRVLDEQKDRRFELAHGALGSKVEKVHRSVYDLDTDLGQFDLIFCGDLLAHLKDPVSAFQGMHRVCRGSTVVCNPVYRFGWFTRGQPLARFDGLDEFEWWRLTEAAMERMALAVGFSPVEVGRRFDLPARQRGKWKGRRGVVRGWV